MHRYYGATIIQMSGIENPESAIWLAVVVAIVNFLATFVGMYVIDRCGRRLLTLVSLFGEFFLGLSQFIHSNHPHHHIISVHHDIMKTGTMLGLMVLGGGFLLAQVYSPPVSLNSSVSNVDSICSSYTCVILILCVHFM